MLRTLARLEEASGSRRGVPNFLSTHPAPAERVQDVLAYVQQNPIPVGTSGRASDEASFQRVVDGIVFGDSPSDGIVRGNEFLHPVLRLALAFPKGWEVQNSATQVVAKAPDRENYMLLTLVPNASGSLQQIAQASMANAGFRQVQGERASLNGLDAYVGTYQGAMEGIGNIVTVAAHVVHNRNVYMFAGLAPPNQFQSAQQQFVASIRSFRELSDAEAARIRPNRVDIYTVRGGDTWESLASRNGNVVKATTLAIMNDYEPNQQPRQGDQIRIVVEG
jgi:predicted Zn-dependent protease